MCCTSANSGNDFSQLVADEYLKLFNFESLTLDAALRKFLKQFQLTGDAQEKERVLMYFAKRYVDQNITAFNDVDSCHTLTCALMLLNTDLHDPKIQNKMTLNEFIENLKGLNNGSNFPEVLLESLYSAIKNEPLECAYIENDEFGTGGYDERNTAGAGSGGAHGNAAFSLRSNNNPFFQMPDPQTAKEYKSGWLLRKCCFDADGKKSAFLKRSWKIFYASLRDMVLYLHKDDKVLKNNTFDNITNAIRIHHALATVASDYKKKQFVFRLKTADWAEYLFQTSNSNELYDWVSCINLVAAMFSSPPLPSAIGSAKTFQRPLMPVSKTRYTLAEQCEYHRKHLKQLHADMARLGVLVADANASIMPSSAAAAANHTTSGATNGSNGHVVHFPNGHANTATNHAFDKDKYNYYQFEIQRYTTYINLLEEQLSNEQQIQLQQQQSAQHHQQHINHMATTIMPQINIINPAQETTILGTSTSSSNSSSTSHYMTSAAHRNGSLCNSSSISTSTTTPKTTVIMNDVSPTKNSMPSTPLHHLTSSSAQAYHNRTPNTMLYKTGSDIMPPISISTGGAASSVNHLHQIMPTTPTTINSKKLVSSYVD